MSKTTERDAAGPIHRYDARLANEIEERWQARWSASDAFRQPNPGEEGFDASRPRYYCLDMFPYPSGAGLHVGHPEGYTATDIVSRYMRMRGYNVLHPMGWDAFGLPAEQYAVQTGIHPATTTQESIRNFRRQLQRFGFSYDWSREFGTIDPEVYRWTQWIFLKIYDSWFDPSADEGRGRARPIADLVELCTKGHVAAGPSDELVFRRGHDDIDGLQGPVGGERLWQDMDDAERRGFLDAHRLAYVAEETVNWCPKLGTALANEEVIDGRSERGGHPVHRKPLKQWLFRITAYAERLLRDLDLVQWPESTKVMQGEWIGRSEGADVDFELVDPPLACAPFLRVYTTRPDTLFGATYMVVAPEHPVVDAILAEPRAATDVDAVRKYVAQARDRTDLERQEGKTKTGVDSGLRAINPVNNETIPVWIADYVLMGYGHGAIMAVPAHDERDHEFATKFGIAIREVVRPADDAGAGECFSGDGFNVNSANDEVSLDGLATADAKHAIAEWLEAKGLGRARVNYRLRDWLFSRQRYWGEPFPVVWDEHGAHHPVAEDRLPVELPPLEDFAPEESEEPRPLLEKALAWVETTAGEAGVVGLDPAARVHRETNTMPGWAGSCWYYLRYCSPHGDARFVEAEAERYWMGPTAENPQGGVDLYIGGAEHAVLHLLYARFWHKVLYDLGEVSTPEPFRRLFHQGMITSWAYQRPDRSLVPIDEVEETAEGVFTEKATGGAVTQVVAKMSKSLKNVINPDDVIASYGADTFRLYEMYMGALADSKPWNTRDILGMFRFLQRVWRLVIDEQTGALKPWAAADAKVERRLHRTIAKVGADTESLALNTAIAAMIEWLNEASGTGVSEDQFDRFVRVLAPFAPHIAEELWSRMGHDGLIARASWPEFDESKLKDDTIEIAVQIAGKVRARIEIPADADAAAMEAAALAHPRVKELLAGKPPRKVITVPARLVNLIPQ